jgi:hypothetical protein
MLGCITHIQLLARPALMTNSAARTMRLRFGSICRATSSRGQLGAFTYSMEANGLRFSIRLRRPSFEMDRRNRRGEVMSRNTLVACLVGAVLLGSGIAPSVVSDSDMIEYDRRLAENHKTVFPAAGVISNAETAKSIALAVATPIWAKRRSHRNCRLERVSRETSGR